MSQCPHCYAPYIAGELYCSSCGKALPAPVLWPLHAPEAPPKASEASQSKEPTHPEAAEHEPAKPQHLRLQLPSGMIIDLQGRETTLIGRKDVEANPDIDLVPYGGLEKGVSRQHAMIVLDDGRYYIKDLKSTNYTLLNAARLLPEQLYPLKHDDQLTLGDLEIRVLL
jgi:hypothetical protein